MNLNEAPAVQNSKKHLVKLSTLGPRPMKAMRHCLDHQCIKKVLFLFVLVLGLPKLHESQQSK